MDREGAGPLSGSLPLPAERGLLPAFLVAGKVWVRTELGPLGTAWGALLGRGGCPSYAGPREGMPELPGKQASAMSVCERLVVWKRDRRDRARGLWHRLYF